MVLISIKEKLRTWLFSKEIEEIEKLKEVYKEIDLLSTDIGSLNLAVSKARDQLQEAKCDYQHSLKIAEKCRETMNTICDVGVDVGFRDEYHSWAVVCIHGKTEFVKFVPLNQKDVRYIADFLKQFEYSKRRVDSPLGYREMIEDYILKL